MHFTSLTARKECFKIVVYVGPKETFKANVKILNNYDTTFTLRYF